MKVNNPLTIIAIFAAVSEVFATIVLIQIPEALQPYFMGFVIFFPILLVSLFFIVLWNKPESLYAPSDFDDPEHYLIANNFRSVMGSEAEKVLEEFSENELSKENISKIIERLDEGIFPEKSGKFDDDVLEYMRQHSDEAFHYRALGHIFVVSSRTMRETLERLVRRGVVTKGVDLETKTVLWQANNA